MTAEKKLHLDRRARSILSTDDDDSDDRLLSTRELANWLGVSTQWCTIGRHRGWGPPYVRISDRIVMYRRVSVREWLKSREHMRTNEYRRGNP